MMLPYAMLPYAMLFSLPYALICCHAAHAMLCYAMLRYALTLMLLLSLCRYAYYAAADAMLFAEFHFTL